LHRGRRLRPEQLLALRSGSSELEVYSRDTDNYSDEQLYFNRVRIYGDNRSADEVDEFSDPDPSAARWANSMLDALGLPLGPKTFSEFCYRVLGLPGPTFASVYYGVEEGVGKGYYSPPDLPRTEAQRRASEDHDPRDDQPGALEAWEYFYDKYDDGTDNGNDRAHGHYQSWLRSGKPPPGRAAALAPMTTKDKVMGFGCIFFLVLVVWTIVRSMFGGAN